MNVVLVDVMCSSGGGDESDVGANAGWRTNPVLRAGGAERVLPVVAEVGPVLHRSVESCKLSSGMVDVVSVNCKTW